MCFPVRSRTVRDSQKSIFSAGPSLRSGLTNLSSFQGFRGLATSTQTQEDSFQFTTVLNEDNLN